ncbi:[citrate (pro-3S)-lyase] ligase [Collinsella tanakaei]|uniref:[citrate (pro-3S)-lyase] ligase n=1 Tax=Collinsella tanakaei TaxID=626935 RepID=UPI0025A4710E|nr:[citrate (pro-3S)-lyase] ligase [Collinsella tanakaei]MDM8302363.1 [citrate (pro-3S)-lyase] ligase [Collinsella tanakaei]
MLDFTVSKVWPTDRYTMSQVDALLEKEGIQRDGNLDYTCAIQDDDMNVIATGSCFGNTLRCLAVDSRYQGEGLMNKLITHLIDVQYERGNVHLFVYTKVDSAKFFCDLGFKEIARVDGTLVFLENRADGSSGYLRRLAATRRPGTAGAVVMNANPFTLGHRHLIEVAAAAVDTLHLFVVSEDASLVPFAVRKRLICEGVADLDNVVVHESGPYIISSATFPSYFLKDDVAVNEGHARLDIAVFGRIAAELGITRRFVGEEPTSQVTGVYNRVMCEELPRIGVEVVIVPRIERNGAPISASTVRRALQEGDMETVRELVPATTYDYFASDEAAPVLERIRKAGNVVHY